VSQGQKAAFIIAKLGGVSKEREKKFKKKKKPIL